MDSVLSVSAAGEEEAAYYQSARASDVKGQLDEDMDWIQFFVC